jgi:signal transduction histidine kinase/ActR/RegA family two-component response regulator
VERTYAALGRAFALWCESDQFDFEKLIHRIAWELQHFVSAEGSAVAIVVRMRSGRVFVGKSFESNVLPIETLLGLVAESDGESLACRVWDHALDGVRFIDSRFRSSILAKAPVPASFMTSRDLVLWYGTSGVASQAAIERAASMAEALVTWFETYAPAIDALQGIETSQKELQKAFSNLQGVLHDARAPVGILKYALRKKEGEAPHSSVIEDELTYLEEVLRRGAPQFSKESGPPGSEVAQILRRVQRRFQEQDAKGPEISVSSDYESIKAKIPEVDLERVVTNLVGNAVRCAPRGAIRLEAKRVRDEVLVQVSDNGVGMPSALQCAILHGKGVHGDGSGWGVGLLNCKSLVELAGGRFEISVPESGGTEVRLSLPCEPFSSPAESSLMIAERRVEHFMNGEGDGVYIVDDDVSHAESLQRVLSTRGVAARVCSSIAHLRASSSLRASAIVLCDVHMPDGGAETLLSMFAGQDDCPSIGVMSGDVSDELVYKLAALGARGFFCKPVALEEILDWIDLARERAVRRPSMRGALTAILAS